jgi:DNA polymerase-3 subunit gamma/tau
MSSASSIQAQVQSQTQAPVQAQTQVQPQATATAVAVEAPEATGDPGKILGFVISELENAGHSTLAAVLEAGSAVLQNDELTVTIAKPASVFGVIMGQQQKLAANAAASAIVGRPIKIVLASGVPASDSAPVVVSRPAGNGASARSRAAEDPIVRRMREKFGAEIRTVIDYRNKN